MSKQIKAKFAAYLPLLTGLLIAGAFILLFSGLGTHLFTHNNRFENARRYECQHNLRQIAEALRDKNLILAVTNQIAIQTLISQMGLICPSGKIVHRNDAEAAYKLSSVSDGKLQIIEDEQNHNPSKMKRTTLSWLAYYLANDWQLYTNDIALIGTPR